MIVVRIVCVPEWDIAGIYAWLRRLSGSVPQAISNPETKRATSHTTEASRERTAGARQT